MFESLYLFADATSATDVLKSGIAPIISTMIAIAAILCVLFIVFGGYHYMTSAGHPEKLDRAKKIIRNSLIGFAVVFAAGSLVAIMQTAYSSKPVKPLEISQQQAATTQPSTFNDIASAAIKNLLQDILKSIGQPIIDGLKHFTTATPPVAQNGAVFNLWVVIVAITDVLFLLVVALIGFRIMGASVVGLGDVDIRSLAPQAILAFVLANISIFAIDAIITVSNAMVQALLLGMSNDIIWVAFGMLISTVSNLSMGVLFLVLAAFLLALILLIYYLQRIIVLYVGAVLSPLIILLWLLPSYRDFAITAAKTYLTTIFVLFVHMVILMLAVSLFSTLIQGKDNPFMTALLGIATMLVLLKTSRAMSQLTMLSAGSYAMRQLGSTFVSGASYIASSVKQTSSDRSSDKEDAPQTSSIGSAPSNTIPARSTRRVPLATGETQPAPRQTSSDTSFKKRGSTQTTSPTRPKSSDSSTSDAPAIRKVTSIPSRRTKK